MANARIVGNNTGHDRTGVKKWKWKQVRECLIDPCVCQENLSLITLIC